MSPIVVVKAQERHSMVKDALYVRGMQRAVQAEEFSRNEAALYLGVSVRTIDRLREDGELESFLVRSSVKIPKESVDAYKVRQRDIARREREHADRPAVKDDFEISVPFLEERRNRRAA